MSSQEFPLAVIIRAVDRVTEPMRRISQRIQQVTAPVRRVANAFQALSNEAGLPRVVGALAAVGGGVRNVARETLALGAKFAVMTGLAAAGLMALVKGTAAEGDTLAKTARKVGLSTQAYAELEFVAKRAGISGSEFAVAMDQLNRRMGQLRTGKGELVGFLQQTNPKLLQQMRATKSTEEAFQLYMAAIAKLPDSQRQAITAYNAFGRSGTKVTAMVSNGVGEIEDLRAEFRRLAGDMTDFGERSEALSDAFDDWDTAASGARVTIVTEFMPAFTDLLKVVTDMVAGNRGAIKEWAREFVAELPGNLRRLRDQFVGLRDALAPIFRAVWPLIESFGVLNSAAVALAAILSAKLIIGIASLVMAIRGLGIALLATPLGWITLAVLALGAAVAGIVIYWDDLTAAVKRFEAAIPDWLRVLMTANPLGAAFNINRFITDLFSGSAPKPGSSVTDRPTTGAESLRPGSAPAVPGGENGRVVVDFQNVPRWARIVPDRSGSPVDLSVGYSMSDGLAGMP